MAVHQRSQSLPQPPVAVGRYAWERYYTQLAEYHMAARDGRPALRPSAVREAARADLKAAWSAATGGEPVPAWMESLGLPKQQNLEPVVGPETPAP